MFLTDSFENLTSCNVYFSKLLLMCRKLHDTEWSYSLWWNISHQFIVHGLRGCTQYINYICSSSSSSSPIYPYLPPYNRGDQIYLKLLEIALTPKLHHDWLFASLAFSPTFLLWSTTTFMQVSLVNPLFLSP